MKQEMKDWRGNSYKEEKLTLNGKPVKCDMCYNQAVRNCCIAEGDKNRTHWHGAIHTHDGSLKSLCRACADKDHAWRNKVCEKCNNKHHDIYWYESDGKFIHKNCADGLQ